MFVNLLPFVSTVSDSIEIIFIAYPGSYPQHSKNLHHPHESGSSSEGGMAAEKAYRMPRVLYHVLTFFPISCYRIAPLATKTPLFVRIFSLKTLSKALHFTIFSLVLSRTIARSWR